MKMIPVVSTNIASVGYENGTLVVAFRSGQIYAYQGVPLIKYQQFLNAPSKGNYFNTHIKKNYISRRIR